MKKIRKIIIGVIVLALTAIIGAAIAVASYSPTKKTVYEFVEKDEDEQIDSKNILFLGMDREASLTDVIMLVNVNNTEERFTVLQIPRDTYAEYTEAGYKKLNGAYNSTGGAAGVADFFESAMGIEIDHYVCIGLDVFAKMVDAVGGVEINLPIDMHYSDPEQGLYIDLDAGKQVLNGNEAEQFVRFRAEYADGDLGRIDAQKLFMAAFFTKIYTDFSPIMAAKLTAAADGVETNISATQMLSLGARSMNFGAENILFLTLPGRDEIAKKSGSSYYVLSRPATKEILNRYFGADGDFDKDGIFLNENYESFKKIYEEYAEYDVNSVSDILRDGI